MSRPLTSEDDRLTRLEELTFFQEERIKALDAALTAQQLQLDKLEQDFSDATSVIRLLREKLGDQPENSLPGMRHGLLPENHQPIPLLGMP